MAEILSKKFEILDADDSRCRMVKKMDVLNEAFGLQVKGWMKGYYHTSTNPITTADGEDVAIWMPNLYFTGTPTVINQVCNGGDTIEEVICPGCKDPAVPPAADTFALRLVFTRDSASAPHYFMGLYKVELQPMKHVYTRIAKRVKLIGDPVYEIQIIE